MPPKVKENKDFEKWMRDWIAASQQNRAPVQDTLREKTSSADLEEPSDDAQLSAPKRRAVSSRHVASGVASSMIISRAKKSPRSTAGETNCTLSVKR
jgi:ferric-dicitrate binding protein FerR (iron transport regulator)